MKKYITSRKWIVIVGMLLFIQSVFVTIPASAINLLSEGAYPLSAAARWLHTPEDDFVITVKTDNQGLSSDNQFTIPVLGGVYNYNVDCDNDGTLEATGISGEYTCDYTEPGTYTIRIMDNTFTRLGFSRIYFNYTGDAQKLLSIEQWGTGTWISMGHAFAGCYNLTLAAEDKPDLTNLVDMSQMFAHAQVLNQDIGDWNTSKVKYMDSLFAGASAFNQDIGDWDTSNVEYMYYLFTGASAFNQDIGKWDTSNVIGMSSMFRNATAFNQDIGGWDTSNVREMDGLFFGASSFNQDISGWDTSQVTDMSEMFKQANGFNQNIGSWNVTALDYANGMFDGIALSTGYYDALLIGWSSQALRSGVTFSGGNSTYCAGEAARQKLINVYGWKITDGGKNCPGGISVFLPLVLR